MTGSTVLVPKGTWLPFAIFVLGLIHSSISFQIPDSLITRPKEQFQGFVNSFKSPIRVPKFTDNRLLSLVPDVKKPACEYPTQLHFCQDAIGYTSESKPFRLDFRYLGLFNLNAGTNSDNGPSTAGKIRSLFQKIWVAILHPLRLTIWNPISRIVQKFRRKEDTMDEAPHDNTSVMSVSSLPMIVTEPIAADQKLIAEVMEVVLDTPGDGLEVRMATNLQEPQKRGASLAYDSSVNGESLKLVEIGSSPAQVVSRAATGVKEKPVALGMPTGDRWAVSAPGVDLSGDWTMIISDEFRKDYDEYLKQLGQPFLVRSVALTIIGMTSEETRQSGDGRTLLIRGQNARGVWERTLVSSGAEVAIDKFTPLQVPIITADDERVEAEAWWEEQGTVHKSWMRGVSKYGGGDFESKRYLEKNGKVLVCESTFHPYEEGREKASVTWRFRRIGETLDD